ncbi:MAG: hypothetical protein AMXMBFR13_47750 [Phycisphaerae bacterium]
MFGRDYASHDFRVTFAMIVLCTAIMTYKAGLARVLAANNLLWWGFLSNAVWAIILIASAAALIRHGAPGLAVSLVIAYSLNTVILLPLYRAKNLVPKGTLLSFESVLIWTILVGLVLLNVADVSMPLRAAVFLPGLLLAAVAFKRLLGNAA